MDKKTLHLKFVLLVSTLLLSSIVVAQQKMELGKTGLFRIDSTAIFNYPNVKISSQLQNSVYLLEPTPGNIFLFNPPNISTDPEYKNERINHYSKFVSYKIDQSNSTIPKYHVIQTANSGVSKSKIDTLFLTIHFEQDLFYHQGDNNATNTPERTPGEGWIWKFLSRNQKFTNTSPPIISRLTLPLTINLKARGISKDPKIAPDHKISVRFYGTTLTKEFSGYSFVDSIFQFTAKPGTSSTVEVTSNGITGTTVDQIYIDYYKISGRFINVLDTAAIEIKSLNTARINDQYLTIRSNINRSFALLDTMSKRLVLPQLLDSTSTQKILTFNINGITADNAYIIDLKSSFAAEPPMPVQMTDINLTNENYVIITHPDFIDFANQYKDYKSGDFSYKIKIVDTDNIYFKYSNNAVTPYAIKAYLSEQYKLNPKLKYVLLVGNSSWDYRYITATGSQKRDYLPAFGMPSSDQWYSALNPLKPYESNLVIGRLPLNSNNEGLDYIKKLEMQNENLKYQKNVKKFTFVNGGFDPSEQKTFLNQTLKIINEFVRAPGVQGAIDTIIKRTIGYEYAGYETPKIQKAFHDGTVWMNYIGHAGSRTWDLMLNDPNQLPDTKTVFPFVTSMTCFTGDFANPNQESFSELFVLNPIKGSIAFVGTSGLGYVSYDEVFIRQVYNSLLLTKNKNLAQGIIDAKNYLAKTYPNSSFAKEIIREYIYIGDPTINLPISNFPNLSISSESTLQQTGQNQYKLNLIYSNIGLIASDSVSIVIDDQTDLSNKTIEKKKQKLTSLQNSAEFLFALSDPGLHQIKVNINWATLTDSLQNDNEFYFSVFVPANSVEFLNFSDGQMVNSGDFKIYMNTPKQTQMNWLVTSGGNQVVRSGSKSFIGFDSLSVASGLSTGFYQLQYQTSDDTSTYKYHFKIDPTTKLNSFILPKNFKPNQFVLDVSQNKIAFRELKKTISITSASYAAGGYGNVSVGDTTIIATNPVPAEGTTRSLLIVQIDKLTKQIKDYGNFDVYLTNAESDRAEAWLNSRINTNDLFAFSVSHDATRKVLPSLKLVIKSLGSVVFDTLKYNTSWAFLGSLTTGKIMEDYGLNIQQKVSIGTDVSFSNDKSIFSISGTNKLPLKSVSFSNISEMDTIVTIRYPAVTENKIEPGKSLIIDGNPDSVKFSLSNSKIAPENKLQFNEVVYSSPIETGILPKGPTKPNIVVGEPFEIQFSAFHTAIDTSAVLGFKLEIRKNNILLVTKNLQSKKSFLNKVLGFSIDQNELNQTGDYSYIITITSPGVYSSFSAVTGSFMVNASSFDPLLNLTVNGKTVDSLKTEMIPAKSKFSFELTYSDFLPLTDTLNSLSLKFNNESITWADHIIFVNNPEVRKTIIQIDKQLETGTYYIEMTIKTPYGTWSQTPKRFSFLVRVVEDDGILDVLNFPNPFQVKTKFNFMITGAEVPKSGHISIYTVNGLKINTLEFNPELGSNIIEWDGTDKDSDRVANGIYLYKVIVEFQSGKKEVLQKLLKLE